MRGVPEERIAILIAYHLPGDASDQLYPTISPVNTFRLIFSLYLSVDFELLEDVSSFSTYEQPFDRELVPNSRDGCDATGDEQVAGYWINCHLPANLIYYSLLTGLIASFIFLTLGSVIIGHKALTYD